MGIFKQSIASDKEKQLPYLCYMAATMCIGIRTYTKLQSYFESPKAFFEAGNEKLEKTGIFTKTQLKRFSDCRSVITPQKELEKLKEGGMCVVSCDEDLYPEKLRNIKDMPPFLFYKGKLPKSDFPTASVIGARECTPYGANVAKKLGELFAKNNVAVVSGMARGIDSIAQSAAVDAGGNSYAFLGGGPDIIYPPQARNLYENLVKSGGVISEFPPGTAPLPQYFAMRNRLIAGLSDVVCVVEAKEKSGTLITVDCALDQGREVYAVPGRVTDITSFGTNELIRQGAGVISDPERFVEEFASHFNIPESTLRKMPKEEICDFSDISEPEKEMILACEDNSFTADEISNRLSHAFSEVISMCLLLCKKGYMENIGAGRFMLTGKGNEARTLLVERPEESAILI